MDNKPWYQKQLRILQTVLREPDVVGYDAESVASYLEDIHANCIVINAGGVVDFFRHELETANPNPFMKEEDILRDLTAACHRRGIKVIARVDYRGVDKRIYDLYPDWFTVDAEGQPVQWAASPKNPNPLYAACYLSHYRNGHAFRMAKLLLERYDLDGIWENSPFQLGACYCHTCRKQYRQDKDKDIPVGGEFSDTRYEEYREWKAESLNRHFGEFREVVKAFGEEKIYCAEIFGLFYNQYASTSSDLYQVKDDFDFLVTPLFTANHQPLSAPAMLTKFLRALEPEKVPIMLFGHLGTNNELRYISSPAAETRIWLWQAVSAGGSLWNSLFNGMHPGVTFDRRNAYLCKDVYAYMEEQEALLHGQTPMADVAIYYSRTSNNRFGSGDREKDAYITHLMGMEQVLIRNKLQYRFLLDLHLTEEALREVRCLVIPNGACLSDPELELIRTYVREGGQVLVTHETSLYDEHGREREDLGLGDVLGVTYKGLRKEASHYGYQMVRASHPLTKGFEDTQLLANWGTNLLVQPLEGGGADTPISYVPQIFPQSPERAWPKQFETEFPTCVDHRYGEGRAIYYPYGVDKQVWSHGHADFSAILGNAFDALLGERRLVRSDAPGSVQLMLNRTAGGYLLHVVNTTAAPVRPVHEVVPVQDIVIELELSCDKVERFQPLREDGGATLEQTEPLPDGGLKLTIRLAHLSEYCGVYVATHE
ncbi:alpha-amylase family protein [Paenibacillus daejeonensis]|uniref:alpha-amylase family protein n=1 Tax=Paenibacillus daejeonensis TaxID=135193 RepID=UPI00035ED811|nr:alpha-amylase family protein [Paenibacillus daejeonensis]